MRWEARGAAAAGHELMSSRQDIRQGANPSLLAALLSAPAAMDAHRGSGAAAGIQSLPDDLLVACLRPLTLKERWAAAPDRFAAGRGRAVAQPAALTAFSPPTARSSSPLSGCFGTESLTPPAGTPRLHWCASAGRQQ